MMSTPAVVAPAAFIAFTMYVPTGESALGVPEITPVLGLRLKPAGKVGLTL
jgi:hypothetical protein